MLSASIVTYHTDESELTECLNSLAASPVDKIYIADNGREQRIKQIADTHPAKPEYIPLPNRGYGAGHNAAMNRALASGADKHLVLNSDIKFGAEVIPALLKYMSEHPESGILQPKIINSKGELEYSARMLPTPADLILRRFLPKRWFKSRRKRYILSHIDHSRPFISPYLEGSFMLLNMDAIKLTGGFDERFFMYPEDIDLSRRIYSLMPTVYCPVATITHLHRRASYRSLRMLLIHCKNMILYFNKWGWFYDPGRREANKRLK